MVWKCISPSAFDMDCFRSFAQWRINSREKYDAKNVEEQLRNDDVEGSDDDGIRSSDYRRSEDEGNRERTAEDDRPTEPTSVRSMPKCTEKVIDLHISALALSSSATHAIRMSCDAI